MTTISPGARLGRYEIRFAGVIRAALRLALLSRGDLRRVGEAERAFACLEQAYEERSEWLIRVRVEPRLDALRSDPRFADLPRRVGLTQ